MEYRIGNYVNDEVLGNVKISEIRTKPRIIKVDAKGYVSKDQTDIRTYTLSDWNNVLLTEEILLKCGFIAIENSMYINGKQWLMQVTEDYRDEGEIINRDGTWFDAIGTHSFMKNGAMAVNILCRGNYVCNNVKSVHQLQNLYFALTGKELEITL